MKHPMKYGRFGWRLASDHGHSHFELMQPGTSFAFPTARQLSRQQRIARLDALATLFDTAFVVPGTNIRFGIDAVIRLVPGIGDLITTFLALYVVNEARALGAPRLLIARMAANVALDSIVGAVPLVGDAMDVAGRVNRRNMALLRKHLDREETPGPSSWTGRGFSR